jgi:hypothetical protein
MPAEQNSLRAAVERILGFSPGGSATAGGPAFGGGGGGATGLGAGGGTTATALGAAATPTGGEVESGQRPVYSSNMSAMRQPFSNISGAARQSGPVFDPFAVVNSELAALKQRNAELSATLAKPTAAATAPASIAPATAPAATAPSAITRYPAMSVSGPGSTATRPAPPPPSRPQQQVLYRAPGQGVTYGVPGAASAPTMQSPYAPTMRSPTTSMNSAQQYGTNQIYPGARTTTYRY